MVVSFSVCVLFCFVLLYRSFALIFQFWFFMGFLGVWMCVSLYLYAFSMFFLWVFFLFGCFVIFKLVFINLILLFLRRLCAFWWETERGWIRIGEHAGRNSKECEDRKPHSQNVFYEKIYFNKRKKLCLYGKQYDVFLYVSIMKWWLCLMI